MQRLFEGLEQTRKGGSSKGAEQQLLHICSLDKIKKLCISFNLYLTINIPLRLKVCFFNGDLAKTSSSQNKTTKVQTENTIGEKSDSNFKMSAKQCHLQEYFSCSSILDAKAFNKEMF